MKKSIFKIFILGIFFVCVIQSMAQTLHSAYFMEGMPTRHKLNPALASEYGYVSMPMLGDVNVGASSNVGVSTFLYPVDGGEMMNFLNSAVDSKEFLGSLKSQNKIVSELDLSLLAFGFYKWNGFNTFDVSLRTRFGVQMPKEIFEFLKVGRQTTDGGTTYEIEDINANATSYVDIALGHSRNINEKWRVGVKIKGLVGLARANVNIDRMHITMNDATSQWIVNSKGHADISVRGVELENTIAENSKGEAQEIVDGVDFDSSKMGVAGGGLALDFGVTYRPLKELEISASIVDLGFITWRYNKSLETIADEVIYEGINTGEDEDLDDIGEAFADLVDFREVQKSRTTSMLKASLNIGAEYSFLNNAISLGVLSHTRFGKETYAEGMLAVNFRTKKIFMMSVNGTISNMGGSFGTLFNIGLRGFDLFAAIDCYPGLKVTPDYYLPINKFHIDASMGISFNFGKRVLHNDI